MSDREDVRIRMEELRATKEASQIKFCFIRSLSKLGVISARELFAAAVEKSFYDHDVSGEKWDD